MSLSKVLLLLIGLVVLVFIISHFTSNTDPLPARSGSAIVVFGDSLAAGVGASTGADIANLLSKALDQPVVNLGVPGDKTADGLARVDMVLATDPRVVVVLLGGNDAIHKVPVDETFGNVAEIIEIITAQGAAVVLVGEPGGLYGNTYEKEYERLAEEYQVFYVSNILSGLLGRPAYMSDYIHPNDAGYELAVARILPVVKEALGE